MRLLLVVLLALAATACGGSSGSTSGPVSVTTPHGSNRPTEPAPVLTPRARPPAAYIEFGSPGSWMAQGSSCWTIPDGDGNGVSACVDTAGPDRMGLKPLHVPAGTTGRIHLGFVPTEAILKVGGKAVPVKPARTIAFPATRSGYVELQLRHANGDALYFAHVIVT